MEPFEKDTRRCSLLFVEDDEVAGSLIGKAISLKFPGIRLMSADNGDTGLELYREHRPDLVITDIKMPGMDGMEMSAEIKRLDPGALITVMSAYCDTQQYQAASAEIGIDHCLTKPVDYTLLFAIIEQCLAEIETRRGA